MRPPQGGAIAREDEGHAESTQGVAHCRRVCVGAPRDGAGRRQPVPVEKAAYHWPIFSNDYIMMLRVYMRPGKGSNFHIHSNDQISILVEAGANEGQIFGKAEKI